jgi:hypothetical protein
VDVQGGILGGIEEKADEDDGSEEKVAVESETAVEADEIGNGARGAEAKEPGEDLRRIVKIAIGKAEREKGEKGEDQGLPEPSPQRRGDREQKEKQARGEQEPRRHRGLGKKGRPEDFGPVVQTVGEALGQDELEGKSSEHGQGGEVAASLLRPLTGMGEPVGKLGHGIRGEATPWRPEAGTGPK